MDHRHLNHQRLTLAAIDDIIANGGMQDWIDLGLALREDPLLAEKVHHLASQPQFHDQQRYHFWVNHVADTEETPCCTP